jgi:hypothetical protein
VTNTGNSTATHVAAWSVLGHDTGSEGYPPGYACPDTSPTSDYQYRYALNKSVGPSQPPIVVGGPVKGVFPANSNGAIVVGCILYKSGDDELQEKELHAIQIVYRLGGFTRTDKGFEATDVLIKDQAPTLPKAPK